MQTRAPKRRFPKGRHFATLRQSRSEVEKYSSLELDVVAALLVAAHWLAVKNQHPPAVDARYPALKIGVGSVEGSRRGAPKGTLVSGTEQETRYFGAGNKRASVRMC